MVIGAQHVGQPRPSCWIFVTHEPQKRRCPQGTSACRVSHCSNHAHFAQIQQPPTAGQRHCRRWPSPPPGCRPRRLTPLRTAVFWIVSVRSNPLVADRRRRAQIECVCTCRCHSERDARFYSGVVEVAFLSARQMLRRNFGLRVPNCAQEVTQEHKQIRIDHLPAPGLDTCSVKVVLDCLVCAWRVAHTAVQRTDTHTGTNELHLPRGLTESLTGEWLGSHHCPSYYRTYDVHIVRFPLFPVLHFPPSAALCHIFHLCFLPHDATQSAVMRQ